MNDNKQFFTYLIYDKGNNLYKIGRTKNPKQRLKTIHTSNPNAEYVFWFKKDYEKELHKQYVNSKERLEWFNLEEHHLESLISLYLFLSMSLSVDEYYFDYHFKLPTTYKAVINCETVTNN